MHLTDHAKHRMVLRGISALDLQLVLATAERTLGHDHGTTSHIGRGLDGRGIVVVTDSDDHDRIITVMLDENP